MMIRKVCKDNKGMTLVELLVAIAIFAAAIVPMLYAFVYSTGYNFRSQRTMQSTGIAEAIIEKSKGANVDSDDVVYGLQNPGDVDDTDGNVGIFFGTSFDISSISAASSGNTYWLYNIRPSAIPAGGEAGVDASGARRSYDVRVVLTPILGAQTDVTSIQSMTSDTTANFTDWLCAQLQSCDTVAFDKTFDNIKNNVMVSANMSASGSPALPGGTDLSAYFSDSDIIRDRIVLDRKIILTATDTVVNVKVEYYASFDQNGDGIGDSATFSLRGHNNVSIGTGHYDLSCSGTLDNDYTWATGTTPIYVADFDPTPDDGFDFFTGGAVSSVFFYYYPGFHSAYLSVSGDRPSYNDHFELNNNLSTEALDNSGNPEKGLSFYLFKQYDSTVANHSGGEDNYDPDIVINDSTINTYLYDNFLWDCEDGRYLGGESGSYANHPASNVTLGTNCFNMTLRHNPAVYSGYSSGIRNTTDFKALALSDMAVLPYAHHEPTAASDPANPDPSETPQMFQSRWTMEVRVYPHGYTTVDSDEIEIMNSEVLNW